MEAKDHGLLMGTPFLRRVREEEQAKGLDILRQSVLDTLTLHFNPPSITGALRSNWSPSPTRSDCVPCCKPPSGPLT